MRKLFPYLLLVLIAGVFGWLTSRYYYLPKKLESPLVQIKPRPLDKYALDTLSKKMILPSKIEIGEVLEEKSDFTSYLFSFSLDPTLGGKTEKKVTGTINIPNQKGSFPLIVMLRGYVDQELYRPGDGTRRAAEYFAKNGFITIAPDFLGYGASDQEADNIFESRFQTYTTALVLLKSLDTIPQYDQSTPLIWGHSNGGQIALTVLEITKGAYPTVLWAPVSKPFPYSILYYTDESDDRGKLIRRELADFEDSYDVELYSLTNYMDKISAPIQVHQGTFDDAVPSDWTDSLVKNLEKVEKDVEYFKYAGADHNLQPSWGTVVARNLAFFRKEQLSSDENTY